MNDIQAAREFLLMAQDDTIAAQASCVAYSICFHAQQAAEKYLKAFLAYHCQPIPKTHDLNRLLDGCVAIDQSFQNLTANAYVLGPFGVEIRYRASKEEAEKKCPEAWSAMIAILETVRKRLPDEVVHL